jgi:hypothetical protein
VTLEEQRAAAIARAQARLKETAATGPKSQPKTSSIGSALADGWDSAGESIGMGVEGLGQFIGSDTLEKAGAKQAAINRAEKKIRGYQRPEEADGILKNLMEGDFTDAGKSLVYGAAENAAPMGAGIGASLGAGAATLLTGGGAAVGLGLAAAGTAIGATETLGSIRQEKEQKGLSSEVNWADIGTAAASGLVELLPVGKGAKAGGYVLKFTKEGLQEAAQEGLIVGDTALQGGEYVPSEVAQRLFDSGVIGGALGSGAHAGVDATGAALGKVADGAGVVGEVFSKTDNRDFSDDEIRAASLIKRAADDSPEILGNVDDEGVGTAKGAANAALRRTRSEISVVASDLRRLAKEHGSGRATAAINTLTRIGQHQGSAMPENFQIDLREAFNEIKSELGDIKEIRQLGSLVNQTDSIANFTSKSDRDMGGLSRFTKRFDPTDQRNNGIEKGMAVAGLAGMSGITGFMGPASAIAANRLARVVDRLTNRRSSVKRFVDSALKEGRTPAPIEGKTANQALEELKQKRLAEKAQQTLQINLAKEKAQGSPTANPNQPNQAQTKVTAKEEKSRLDTERKAQLYKTNAYALGSMFETGVIPDGDPYYDTYKFMKQQTDLAPADALQVIEKLESEGIVGKGTAQRFAEDPRSFANDLDTTIAIQRAVRTRANPDFKPRPPKDPEQVIKKMSAVGTGIGGTQAQYKAREGKRRKNNLVADIESSTEALASDEIQGLYDLAEAMDSSEVIRADRFKMMNEMLPMIFRDNPVKVDIWKKKFASLAGIGNDKPYTRKPDEQIADEAADERLKEVKARKPKSKKGAKYSAANDNVPPEARPSLPQKPEDRALEKLKNPKPANDDEVPSEVTKARDAEEPVSIGPVQGKKTKKGLEGRVDERIEFIQDSMQLAAEWGDALQTYVDELPPSVEGRVEGLIYDAATDQLTVNMLVENFANRFNVPIEAALGMVNGVLETWETSGRIKRFRPYMNEKLRVDGKVARDAEGNALDVLGITLVDPKLSERVEIAKAVKMLERMVPQDAPTKPFTPDNLQDGAFKALKDIDPSRVDASFTPILSFIEDMRNQFFSISPDMLKQIESALGGVGEKKQGTINEQLTPKIKGSKRRDDGPMRTVAQLLYQLGKDGERTSTNIRQEWGAGANLRLYSKNGLAHSQAGDIMKGLIRLPEKHKLGSPTGLKYVFHGLGNLLGFDKKSPVERRNAIFTEGMVDNLIKFASDPFGRTTMKDRTNQPTAISQMVDDGEGFFQVLNAAHEVKSMVDFARARHKDKAQLSNSDLLKDPDVQADLAENYETDFFVQLDASNNAYQIAGMAMGYEDVLRSTGLLPREGFEGDPDGIQGADIYLQPALSIAERIPELKGMLDQKIISDQKLRKIFKGPIGTYLYAATFNSRQQAFRDTLSDIADPKPIFGIEPDEGLIQIAPDRVAQMRSDEGAVFIAPKYDVNGNVKETKRVRTRVKATETAKGIKYIAQSAEGNGAFKGRKPFDTEAEAIAYAAEMDLFVRMNDELIRDMNTRYPQMREYLKFAEVVSDIVKGGGLESVKVPTKDGMMLEYSFKKNPSFIGGALSLSDGKVVNLGVRTPDYKLAGRGLAAFMTHQNDAWALRETHKRLAETGDLKGFNPIHDSYGFHPSDAAKGQETWVKVMQELGADDYNIFLQILEANGISLQQYMEAGGNAQFIMGRKGVAPVPAQSIPTALS